MRGGREGTTSTVRALRAHPDDNVATLVTATPAGTPLEFEGLRVTLTDAIERGHKVALTAIAAGAPVVKYGAPIGRATRAITPGAWVHAHNLVSTLTPDGAYRYQPDAAVLVPRSDAATFTFDGYQRDDGRVGTRNEIWILNTVGCVNRVAMRIAAQATARHEGQPGVDGIHAFPHPYGCSQLGDDLRNTRRLLAGLMRHPNVGGVLVIGLGCENNQLDDLVAAAEALGPIDRTRLRAFDAQEVDDEIAHGLDAVAALVARMADDRRTSVPASSLVLGLKCGGSDGLSGLTANPLVGRVAETVVAAGGGAVLTEVPEMFGAEQVLMNRAVADDVFRDIIRLIDDFKGYFVDHGQPVGENPSPGNKDGGLTTLEEKSLGAIQKGGRTPITRVVPYGGQAGAAGLTLLEAPGNDAVSSTAMVAAGATVLLFTTGRGTPLGFPVPTIKIASNAALAAGKKRWIDFDASPVLDGVPMTTVAATLWAQVLAVASGALTCNERNDDREIAIWKSGVTL